MAVAEADVLTAARQRNVALTGLAPFWHATRDHEGIVVGYGTPPEHDTPLRSNISVS